MQPSAGRPTRAEIEGFRRDLRLLEREIFRQLEGETSCCGVTLSQCHVLLELAVEDRSLTRLAHVLDLDKSTLSRTVEAMVSLDLVQRRREPGDRRTARLTLTAHGKARVATINGLCDRYYAALLGRMTPTQRRQTVRSVQRLAEGMRQLRSLGPRPAACDEERCERAEPRQRRPGRRRPAVAPGWEA